MERIADLHRRLTSERPEGVLQKLMFSVLIPLSRIYAGLGSMRATLYRLGLFTSYRAGLPVISIGNLAVGGTGKTPAVDLLVKLLQMEGFRVAVVSRGYGVRIKGVRIVCAGEGPIIPPSECGDEPYLLARRNPSALVLVAPRRREGVRIAERDLGAEVVILDDGFQHLAVRRDLDIVLLDARRPFGNSHLLPAGILREPLSALERGDLFIMTRCPDSNLETPRGVAGPILHSRHEISSQAVSLNGREISLESLSGKRGVAFAGLADPQSFFSALDSAGLSLVERVAFADHAAYGPEEISALGALCRHADYLITTEKDGVKLQAAPFPVPCYQVPMTLRILQQGELERIVLGTVRRKK